jgi:SNF2 family DNA or RNA helicase
MYQAIRRCYRFGQKKPVNVYIITSESEGAVRENIARKEKQTEQVFSELAKYSKATIEKEVRKTYRQTDSYEAIYKMEVPQWLMSA